MENPPPLPSPEEQKDVTNSFIQQFLSAREIEITETDAVGIVEETRSGRWTATEVVTAFCHRAALAHQLTNCLHEIFFEQAIANAKELDARFAAENGPIGPLHGLPVSFKDQFHIKGVETTMGYIGWIGTFEGVKGTGKEKVVESELVREVRALGGIPFCKTSLPHTVMSMDTANHIVGHTLNPHNRLMSPGGSSGGEGALIALRGSPIGFGTDIGGSIRVPGAANGIYGLRPSYGRIAYLGAANSMPGQNTTPSVCGPLVTSPSALRMMLEALSTQEPWLRDPVVAEIPWRPELAIAESVDGSKLAFGLMSSDHYINPQPPIRRALETARKLLTDLGHEVIEWSPPSHAEAVDIAARALTIDGGQDLHHHLGLSGEPMSAFVSEFYGAQPSPAKTVIELWEINLQQKDYKTRYLKYWNSTAKLTKSGRPVDAILSPVMPSAAPLRDTWGYPGYTIWVNTNDFPSVTIPVTMVDKDIDKIDTDYKPVNEKDEAIWRAFNPEIQHGTPVGLQLVGRRFQEEKVIALAEIFAKANSG